MADTLFGDFNVKREDDGRRIVRAHALGGILQQIRSQNGWSVEQAAVHVGLGHMTWRRAEDGFDVRRKTYTAIDGLLEVPLGTVQRAMNDDQLMAELIERTGVHVGGSTPTETVDRFAAQTKTNSPRQVRARAAATPTYHFPMPQLTLPNIPTPTVPTNIEVASQLVERMTRLRPTRAIEEAVQAVLKAMPDLVAWQNEEEDDKR